MKPDCKAGIMMGRFKCIDCKGSQLIEIMGGEDMGKKTLCNIKGCEKGSQINGMCKAHAKGTPPRTPVFKSLPVVAAGTDLAGVADPAPITTECMTINLMQVIRDRKQAILDAEMLRLNDALMSISDPFERLKLAADWA